MSGDDLSSYAPKSPDLSSLYAAPAPVPAAAPPPHQQARAGPTHPQLQAVPLPAAVPAPASQHTTSNITRGPLFRRSPCRAPQYQQPQFRSQPPPILITSPPRNLRDGPPGLQRHSQPPPPSPYSPQTASRYSPLVPAQRKPAPQPAAQGYTVPQAAGLSSLSSTTRRTPTHCTNPRPSSRASATTSNRRTRRRPRPIQRPSSSSSSSPSRNSSPPCPRASRQHRRSSPRWPVVRGVPSPVKTKFPTARIKRIMQADEEVGKVAQQTPIAVGKALELFMVALVNGSADVAREKNSKRVSPQMLKQVVESNDQWDFLRDIVAKVDTEEKPEKPAKASRVKARATATRTSRRRGEVGRKKARGCPGRRPPGSPGSRAWLQRQVAVL